MLLLTRLIIESAFTALTSCCNSVILSLSVSALVLKDVISFSTVAISMKKVLFKPFLVPSPFEPIAKTRFGLSSVIVTPSAYLNTVGSPNNAGISPYLS